MADIEMVVVDGVRYRPEDKPKKKADPEEKKREPDTSGGDVKTRARTPRSAATK